MQAQVVEMQGGMLFVEPKCCSFCSCSCEINIWQTKELFPIVPSAKCMKYRMKLRQILLVIVIFNDMIH